MIIGNWFVNMWAYLQKNLLIDVGIFIILCIYIFVNYQSLNDEEKFSTIFFRKLKWLGIILLFYLGIIFVFLFEKKYFIKPYDKMFFPLLCGILGFLILMLINKIYLFSDNRLVILTGIPITFFGVWVVFDRMVFFGFELLKDPGHPPIELISVILCFLLVSSLFIGIKNFVRIFRRIK